MHILPLTIPASAHPQVHAVAAGTELKKEMAGESGGRRRRRWLLPQSIGRRRDPRSRDLFDPDLLLLLLLLLLLRLRSPRRTGALPRGPRRCTSRRRGRGPSRPGAPSAGRGRGPLRVAAAVEGSRRCRRRRRFRSPFRVRVGPPPRALGQLARERGGLEDDPRLRAVKVAGLGHGVEFLFSNRIGKRKNSPGVLKRGKKKKKLPWQGEREQVAQSLLLPVAEAKGAPFFLLLRQLAASGEDFLSFFSRDVLDPRVLSAGALEQRVSARS